MKKTFNVQLPEGEGGCGAEVLERKRGGDFPIAEIREIVTTKTTKITDGGQFSIAVCTWNGGDLFMRG